MIRIALFLPAIFFENMTLQRMHQNFQICGPGHSSWKRKVKYDNSGSCSLVMPSAKIIHSVPGLFFGGGGGPCKNIFQNIEPKLIKEVRYED